MIAWIPRFLRIQPKIVISTMAISVENFKNHIKGEFVKIRKFVLVIIFVIFPQNDNLDENLEISQNSA